MSKEDDIHKHLIILSIALGSSLGNVACAGTPPECRKLPADVREAGREFTDCLRTSDPTASCGPAGLNVQIFGNDEGRLPKARNGQTYYEARAVKEHGPMPGANRLVFLTNDAGGKRDIVARYYSANHYDSFCTYK